MALLVVALARVRPRWPGALLAVTVAAVANSVFGWGVASIGHIPSRLPAPSLPLVPAGELGHLILPAFAVAALAALERRPVGPSVGNVSNDDPGLIERVAAQEPQREAPTLI